MTTEATPINGYTLLAQTIADRIATRCAWHDRSVSPSPTLAMDRLKWRHTDDEAMIELFSHWADALAPRLAAVTTATQLDTLADELNTRMVKAVTAVLDQPHERDRVITARVAIELAEAMNGGTLRMNHNARARAVIKSQLQAIISNQLAMANAEPYLLELSRLGENFHEASNEFQTLYIERREQLAAQARRDARNASRRKQKEA